jgi:hypothetical protein
MRQGTDDHPNKELQHRCAAMSAEGALAASLFTGFPHADIANAGLSAVVVTDADRKLAEELRDELLGRAWVEREAFVYKIEPLAQSVARAKATPPSQPGDGPIVLLDHYDNCASGGTMDTTVVLAEILRQGLENIAAFAIYDPEAVQRAIAAGIGAQVTLSIGGKIKMPAIPGESPPLSVTGTVKTISNGRYKNRGPMARGVAMDMGAAVVLDTGAAEIVLISRHVEPSDLNCLASLGIDPMQKRYVMLKSRIHWRAGLGKLAKAVVECAGVGVCTPTIASCSSTKSGARSTRSTCPIAKGLLSATCHRGRIYRLRRCHPHRHIDAHQRFHSEIRRLDPFYRDIDQASADRHRCRRNQHDMIRLIADHDRPRHRQEPENRCTPLAAKETPDRAHALEAVLVLSVDDGDKSLGDIVQTADERDALHQRVDQMAHPAFEAGFDDEPEQINQSDYNDRAECIRGDRRIRKIEADRD